MRSQRTDALQHKLYALLEGGPYEEAQRLAREKFEASERRASAAKNALGDTKLTDAERTARLKEIYGI